MLEEIKQYISDWRRELKFNGVSFVTFVIPLVAGAVAVGAGKAVKYGQKKYKQYKKKKKK